MRKSKIALRMDFLRIVNWNVDIFHTFEATIRRPHEGHLRLCKKGVSDVLDHLGLCIRENW